MKQPNPKTMQTACDKFNAQHEVGDTIRCWTGLREGKPVERKVRKPGATILADTPLSFTWPVVAGASH